MSKRNLFIVSHLIVLALLLAACRTPASVPAPVEETAASPTQQATAPAPQETAAPAVDPIGANESQTMSLPDLNLTGQLALAVLGQNGVHMHLYDLNSGAQQSFARTNPTTPPPPIFSPDGRYLAYFAPDEDSPLLLFVRDIASQSDVALAAGLPNLAPSWTAAGDQLFFSLLDAAGAESGRTGVWRAGSGQPQLIAEEPAQCAAWSPDGRQLALVLRSQRAEQPLAIHLHSLNSGAAAALPAGAEGEFERDCLRWSPDGQVIFQRTRNDSGIQASLLNPGGDQIAELAEVDGGNGAVWSDDGRHLAFVNLIGMAIYVLDAQTQAVTSLADFSEGLPAQAGHWAPQSDGKPPRLAYNIPAGGQRGLYVWQVGQEQGQQVYHQPLGEAVWAPDGRHFLFVDRTVKNDRITLRVIAADGADHDLDREAAPIVRQFDLPASYYVAQAVLGPPLP